MALGQSEKAVVDATKLTLLEPESADGYIALGLAHFGSGEFDKVIDDFSNAIKRDPRERVAYEIRGLTYALQGRGDLAMTDWVYMMRLPGKEDDGQRSIMTLVDNASSLKGIAQRQLLAGLQKYSNHLRQSSDDDGAKRIDEMVERLRSRLGASSADQSD
jgi:tetratricopeptide (TPR) repeat protein